MLVFDVQMYGSYIRQLQYISPFDRWVVRTTFFICMWNHPKNKSERNFCTGIESMYLN